MRQPARPGSPGTDRNQHDASLALTVTRPRAGTAVLGVGGEVDTLTAPQLEAALTDLLAGPEAVRVVDLSGVTFLASSGLAVLIQAAHRAADRGGRIRVVATTRAVQRPLEITGSDQLFDMHTDPDAATVE